MKYFVSPKNALPAAYDEMRLPPLVSVPEHKDRHLIRPKPRRPKAKSDIDPAHHLHHQADYEMELSELMIKLCDIFPAKDGDVDSPYLECCSPPERVKNPVVHDPSFGDTFSYPILQYLTPPPTELRRMEGSKAISPLMPPVVRVEGFSLPVDRDRRNCGGVL